MKPTEQGIGELTYRGRTYSAPRCPFCHGMLGTVDYSLGVVRCLECKSEFQLQPVSGAAKMPSDPRKQLPRE